MKNDLNQHLQFPDGRVYLTSFHPSKEEFHVFRFEKFPPRKIGRWRIKTMRCLNLAYHAAIHGFDHHHSQNQIL